MGKSQGERQFLELKFGQSLNISKEIIFVFGQHDDKKCTTNAIVMNFILMYNIIHIIYKANDSDDYINPPSV